MEYEFEIEGTFTTKVKVDASNLKVAKIKAAEKFLEITPDGFDCKVDMVFYPENK